MIVLTMQDEYRVTSAMQYIVKARDFLVVNSQEMESCRYGNAQQKMYAMSSPIHLTFVELAHWLLEQKGYRHVGMVSIGK